MEGHKIISAACGATPISIVEGNSIAMEKVGAAVAALFAATPALLSRRDTRPCFTRMIVMKRAGGHPCISVRFRRPDAGATAPTVRPHVGLFFLNRYKTCPSAVFLVPGRRSCP